MLDGEIATRSRVPVALELARCVQLTLSVSPEGTADISISGLVIGPVEGAREVYDCVKGRWAADRESLREPGRARE